MTRDRSSQNRDRSAADAGATIDLSTTPAVELARELAKRYGVQFGRIELTIHDGRPASRVVVEHRLHERLDE